MTVSWRFVPVNSTVRKVELPRVIASMSPTQPVTAVRRFVRRGIGSSRAPDQDRTRRAVGTDGDQSLTELMQSQHCRGPLWLRWTVRSPPGRGRAVCTSRPTPGSVRQGVRVAEAVPDSGVLRDEPEGLLAPTADQKGWPHRWRIELAEPGVDPRQCVTERCDPAARGAELVAVFVVVLLEPPSSDAENEPAIADVVDRSRHVRQQLRVAIGVTGHQGAELDTMRLLRPGSQHRPALEVLALRIAREREKVVPGEDHVHARLLGCVDRAPQVGIVRVLWLELDADLSGRLPYGTWLMRCSSRCRAGASVDRCRHTSHMDRLRVAIAAPVPPDVPELLREREPRIELRYDPELLPPMRHPADFAGDPSFTRTKEQQQYEELLDGADALYGIPDVDAAALRRVVEANPHLRWVHTMAAGGGATVQAAELTDEQLNKIIFTSSAGVHSGPLAEFASSGCWREPRCASAGESTGGAVWSDRWMMGQLAEQTVLVVGLGGIGCRVVELLAPSEERSWAPAGERSPWTGSMRWSIPTNLWRWLAESMP